MSTFELIKKMHCIPRSHSYRHHTLQNIASVTIGPSTARTISSHFYGLKHKQFYVSASFILFFLQKSYIFINGNYLIPYLGILKKQQSKEFSKCKTPAFSLKNRRSNLFPQVINTFMAILSFRKYISFF